MRLKDKATAPGITETDMIKAVPGEVIEPMIANIPVMKNGKVTNQAVGARPKAQILAML